MARTATPRDRLDDRRGVADRGRVARGVRLAPDLGSERQQPQIGRHTEPHRRPAGTQPRGHDDGACAVMDDPATIALSRLAPRRPAEDAHLPAMRVPGEQHAAVAVASGAMSGECVRNTRPPASGAIAATVAGASAWPEKRSPTTADRERPAHDCRVLEHGDPGATERVAHAPPPSNDRGCRAPPPRRAAR